MLNSISSQCRDGLLPASWVTLALKSPEAMAALPIRSSNSPYVAYCLASCVSIEIPAHAYLPSLPIPCLLPKCSAGQFKPCGSSDVPQGKPVPSWLAIVLLHGPHRELLC